MPKALVRHGLISYLTTDKETDREYEDRAFRGMTVNLSQKEYDRLLGQGAIVPDGEELDQPGQLMALPAGASNEEVLNWAMSATETEIATLAAERPELATRLRDAHEEAKRRVELYNERMGGVIETAEEAAERAAQTAEEDLIGTGEGTPTPEVSPVTGGTPAPPVANADGTVTEDVNQYFDAIAQGSNREIENYLGEHPEHHAEVLAAEVRRADAARAAGDEQRANVRSGVRQAVEVAAQHAS